MKLPCGCTPDDSGYGYCYECRKALRTKIWISMSEEQREYDRYFAPDESAALDYWAGESSGCSCHINPPCSYCMSKNEDDEE